jgi:hypothetical protein
MVDDDHAVDGVEAGGIPAVPPAVVYVVQHARPKPDGEEDVKMIGVYSDREKAKAAVARMVAQPGFRDWPDEFHVDEYPLDRDHWTEGFVGIHGNDILEGPHA